LLWNLLINISYRKSRIAIEYCYKYRENNPEAQILWVNGGNRARFEADFWYIARAMQIPGFYHPKIDTLQLVSDWLSDKDNGSWLMVLDNADDEELWITPATQESAQQDSQQQSAPLICYVPRGSHGYVLITARNSQLGKTLTKVKEKPIDVLPLRPKDAEILLRSKLSEDDKISLEDANDFTKALDYLPLAITQAAAYLDHIDMTFAKYLQLFRAGKADTSDLLKKHAYDSGRDCKTENSVFQTWRISFNQISRQNPRAAEVLSLMAVLDRHVISEYLLRDDGEPELEFISAIQKLKAFSLVTKEVGASSYSMHRLVQDSTQEWLKHEGTIEEWQEKALTAVSQCCPDGGYDNWKAWEAINPHVQVVLGYKLHKYLCRLQRASLLKHCACYDEEQGRYSSAHEKATEAQDIYQDFLGEEDPNTLISMKQVASAQKGLSKYKESKDIYERLLKLCGKVLGEDHPLTLACLSDLAITVRHLGDYAEAERMNRVALEGRDNVLGKEHRDTLASVNNLAEVLKNQGQYQEAEELTRRALETMNKVMGEEHPDTISSVSNLAEIMTCQGKYSEAEEMHRQALRVREKKLGKEHPVTLISVGNLALLLYHHKKYGEALPIGRRALEVREKVLGKDYAGTLTSAKTLALILQGLRDYNGAEEMIRRCLHGRERLFGTENPSTLTAASILAFILQDQGRYDESEARHRQVLAAREKVLREDHSDIMRSIQGLTSVLGCQGKREEVKRMNERALEWKEKAQVKRPAE
jgi:tetratricopeptide (TPR) repeat protein